MDKTYKSLNYQIAGNPYNLPRPRGERNSREIITVPDEAMSIEEILRKHVNGIRLDHLHREPQYDSGASFDSEDITELARMDTTDRLQLARERAIEIHHAKEAAKQQKQQNQPKPKPEESPSSENAPAKPAAEAAISGPPVPRNATFDEARE